MLGRFDKVVASGSKRWAFNYINTTESHVRMFNLTPSFYVLEMANMTTDNIINDVSNLINSTK